MLEQELVSALSTIEGCQNPEIHHYHQNSHPGVRWYIKTILPHPSLLENDDRSLWDFWQNVFKSNRRNVRIIDKAYSWNGQLIPGWHTIWLDTSIDIEWDYDESMGFSYSVIDYDTGINRSATRIENWIARRSDRHPGSSELSCERLLEIAEYLRSHTSDKQAKKTRSRFKVIDDNEI